jgi:hypothetical protein
VKIPGSLYHWQLQSTRNIILPRDARFCFLIRSGQGIRQQTHCGRYGKKRIPPHRPKLASDLVHGGVSTRADHGQRAYVVRETLTRSDDRSVPVDGPCWQHGAKAGLDPQGTFFSRVGVSANQIKTLGAPGRTRSTELRGFDYIGESNQKLLANLILI